MHNIFRRSGTGSKTSRRTAKGNEKSSTKRPVETALPTPPNRDNYETPVFANDIAAAVPEEHVAAFDMDEGEDRFGLKTLWPPRSNSRSDLSACGVDIVAIHGLGGDLYDTWKEKETGRIWLRDFLPVDIKDAHIMTFGYNASLAFTGSVSRIEDFARALLESLKTRRKRVKTQSNPLIFVCHSLGGIVFKKV
ncbi:hypothetical protein LTR56_012705 [Elasticomyces elasticus]|nr:hypothetical protein LTR56_012705 [Elasticomyces elasticus]KAK4918764.1 hypothetical protein LTR49_013551 [Elasticomyces elasticus]KAK5754407.1 hypothetical protein LTS12_015476 [Elasticomyces elasticus]